MYGDPMYVCMYVYPGTVTGYSYGARYPRVIYSCIFILKIMMLFLSLSLFDHKHE